MERRVWQETPSRPASLDLLRSRFIVLRRVVCGREQEDQASWTSFGDRKDASVLQEAVEWFKERDIPLYGINENPDQHSWTTSPKAYGHICIDDNCLGVPLKGPNLLSHRPYVNWDAVRLALTERNTLPKVSE